MDICQLNISRSGDPMYATKKYEEALFRQVSELTSGSVARRRRRNHTLVGSTPVAWFIDYGHVNADIAHATFQTIAPAMSFVDADYFVVTVHDVNPLRYPPGIFKISERLQWRFTPAALYRADAVIAISEFTKRELTKLTPIEPGAVTVVHQGVDHDMYRPLKQSLARERLDLDPAGRYVLVVSSNAPHKRMDLARSVYDELRERDERIQLLKAGYGDELRGDGIRNVGWLPESDMPLLYNAADVYLHPSEYEGFGLPVLEAMSCGLPVVANDRASIPEFTTEEGLINMSDSSASLVADRVVSRMGDGPDDSAIERSREFSWDRTARETLAVYDSVGA